MGAQASPSSPKHLEAPPPTLAQQKLQTAFNKISIYLLALEMSLTIWYIK